MGDNINKEYFEPGVTTFNYNNVTGGADSASGGSGGSGMECLQLRSPPGPFQYLISEQAKSLVALQELQNEVGALLEFRDLVIETFPNLRSKMPPSTPASSRRDWEPGVRVRRKLANGDQSRTKPQPSVQDSGFSTETSCGKDASASASQSTRSRPLEDELWALLDVIQRKGVRLRDEAELLRGELDERHSDTAEESFARALTATGGCTDCADVQLLRCERDALLARAAQLEAEAEAGAGAVAISEAGTKTPPPLGRLDAALETPSRPPRVSTPDSKKFAAILLESNPVELQRQLLTSTVQNQVLSERLRRAAAQRTLLLERLERTRELNEDLKFRLEEKSIELEGSMARIRQLEARPRGSPRHCSMRDMEPLPLPPDEDDAPRRRPSRIPLHTANKGTAPRPPSSASGASVSGMNASGASASGISASVTSATPPRPASAHSARSTSARRSAVPVRRDPATDKVRAKSFWNTWFFKDS
ncbi:hypothetical protein ACJJTC_006811 [Scirpophaga incertulas]